MKKLFSVLLSAVLTMLAGCAAVRPAENQSSAAVSTSTFVTALPPVAPVSLPPSATDVKSPIDYFPVKADTHMIYEGSGFEYAGFDQYVDYIGSGTVQLRTNNTGTESVSVYTIGKDAVTRVFTQGETYYRYDFAADRMRGEQVLKAPLAVGNAWSLGGATVRRITAVDAAVTLPFGTFKALEVTTEDASGTTNEYYAPGVGLIKRVFTPKDSPETKIISALEKIETDSALMKNIRFYYPDTKSGGIVYVDRKVSFRTGDSVEKKLADGLKAVPEGSGYTRVLTKGAAINRITVDLASGIVTADLSRAFITEMNAGSGFEGQLLESLGDTLGQYFQTKQVAITIDGGTYESGHFLFRKGDFLPCRPDRAIAYPMP